MDKGAPPSLFLNDGSFMERFKQLQQGQDKGGVVQDSGSKPTASRGPVSSPASAKTGLDVRQNIPRKTSAAPSGGKLAFCLKQKSKLVAPVKLSEDVDEDVDVGNAAEGGFVKRQKLGPPDANFVSARKYDVAPPSPSDPAVKKVADKLASFAAKHGRQIEDITRQKNPGDTPFRFLFDTKSTDYKYYEYRIQEEERALAQTKDSQTAQIGEKTISATSVSQKSNNRQLDYQTPASALYEVNEAESSEAASGSGESDATVSGSDPIAKMEYYMKRAAEEEKRRPPKHSRDEMPPPASLQASGKRGHHMGDYIPLEELESFMAKCNDAAALKAAKEAAAKAKIQADNVGHKLLSKMGWKEGEGLGSSRKGMADPIMAGDVKKDHLGVGAQQPGEVTPDDDIYEQYKKRMLLGYRHRPNPLNNPRKAYY